MINALWVFFSSKNNKQSARMYFRKSVQLKTNCYNKNNQCTVHGIVQYSTLKLWPNIKDKIGNYKLIAKHAKQSNHTTKWLEQKTSKVIKSKVRQQQ